MRGTYCSSPNIKTPLFNCASKSHPKSAFGGALRHRGFLRRLGMRTDATLMTCPLKCVWKWTKLLRWSWLTRRL